MPDYGRPIEFGFFLDPAASQGTAILEAAGAVEEAGFDLIGIQDHPYNRGHFDTFTLMAMILAQTRRVRVFPDVTCLPLRPPAMLAKAAATLDQLSGGRFELGLGAGAVWDPIGAMGGPVRSPGEALGALEEAIQIIRAALGGQRSVDFDGEHYRLNGWRPGPPPAHDVGIWLGVTRRRALELTGRLGDGWVPSMAYVPPAMAKRSHAIIDSSARAAGRDPSSIRRLYNIWGSFTAGPGGPIDETEGQFAGSPEQWIQLITHLATSVGFDNFVIGGPPDPAVLRLIGQEIAPAVRDRVARSRAQG